MCLAVWGHTGEPPVDSGHEARGILARWRDDYIQTEGKCKGQRGPFKKETAPTAPGNSTLSTQEPQQRWEGGPLPAARGWREIVPAPRTLLPHRKMGNGEVGLSSHGHSVGGQRKRPLIPEFSLAPSAPESFVVPAGQFSYLNQAPHTPYSCGLQAKYLSLNSSPGDSLATFSGQAGSPGVA